VTNLLAVEVFSVRLWDVDQAGYSRARPCFSHCWSDIFRSRLVFWQCHIKMSNVHHTILGIFGIFILVYFVAFFYAICCRSYCIRWWKLWIMLND